MLLAKRSSVRVIMLSFIAKREKTFQKMLRPVKMSSCSHYLSTKINNFPHKYEPDVLTIPSQRKYQMGVTFRLMIG